MECRKVELDCGPVAVWERPGHGLPVVLLHGLGADAQTFSGAFGPGVLPDRRLIAPDLPGHGASPRGTCTCTVGDYAEVVLALLAELGVERYDLVAHSMGGAVGIVLAERSGVTRFLNAEGNLTGENCFFSGPTAAMERERFMREGRVQLIGKVGRLASRGSACWEYYVRALTRCDPEMLHRAACGLVDVSNNADLLERYIALHCPTCYVVGTENARDFPGRDRLLEARCEVHAVTGGHFMMLDDPDGFYQVVRGFLFN